MASILGHRIDLDYDAAGACPEYGQPAAGISLDAAVTKANRSERDGKIFVDAVFTAKTLTVKPCGHTFDQAGRLVS